VGDLIALPLRPVALDNSNLFRRSGPMLGRHGGLSREEMLVPLIATRVSH
jgi:hypothetical protein